MELGQAEPPNDDDETFRLGARKTPFDRLGFKRRVHATEYEDVQDTGFKMLLNFSLCGASDALNLEDDGTMNLSRLHVRARAHRLLQSMDKVLHHVTALIDGGQFAMQQDCFDPAIQNDLLQVYGAPLLLRVCETVIANPSESNGSPIPKRNGKTE